MLDTMTLTKATGAVCGSLLVFLFANWAAESLYNTAPSSHGGEEAAQAYSIDTGEAAGGDATAAAGPSFEEVFAAADPAAGEKVFGKCKACHKIDGSNATGPHLNGVVGRNHAAVADFGYSDAMKGHAAEVWSPDILNAFLTNPKEAVPGTKMTFAGLPKVEDRANLIAYLATLK